jgi:phosphate transport system substrate-binding protein
MSARARTARRLLRALEEPTTRGSVMRRLLACAALAALCVSPLLGPPVAGASVSEVTAQIDGSGSTWAYTAINQWVSDVTKQNLTVVYSAEGSADGRADFRNDTTDFAVSDVGFLGYDSVSQTWDTNCQNNDPTSDCRPYAYLPVVAGGTSFPYQIRVAGQLVESLRLSGETVAKIFTGQITNWDNAEIAQDNNHRFDLANGSYVTHLPSTQIITVVDSEGSGASYQFTAYLDALYPSIYRAYSGSSSPTEYWPQASYGASPVREAGSDGIINEITSAAANGAIGYDQYSYALGKNWPVALLENQAGYFTAPTQYNVAVALTKAHINMDKNSPDYLLQNLANVYTNPDKRSYAMSSYSYMIIPTSPTDPRMGTNAAPKAQTLADFIDWSICGGQAEVGPIGYSPLPINLAQASFQQMYKLHTADRAVQISNLNVATDCNNPTFWAGHATDINHLAVIAPQPPACDQAGQGPCTPGTGVGPTGNPQGGKAPAPRSTTGTSSSPGTTGNSGSGNSSPGTSAGTGGSSSSGTGSSGSSTGGTAANGETLVGSPSNLAESEGSGLGGLLAVLAVVEVLLLLAIPPIIARRRQQRGAGK